MVRIHSSVVSTQLLPGLNRMFHLDYLTADIGTFDQSVEFYRRLTGETPTQVTPLPYATRTSTFSDGASISEYDSRAYLTLSGVPINNLSNKQLLAVLRVSTHATRIDLTWDHVPITLDDVRAEANAQLYTVNGIRQRIKPIWYESDEGKTLYLGAVGAFRRVRFYDMHGYTRMEFQLREKYAAACVKHLRIAAFRQWSAIAAGHAGVFCTFDSAWFPATMGLAYTPLASRRKERQKTVLEAMLAQYGNALRRESVAEGNDTKRYWQTMLDALVTKKNDLPPC